MLRCIVKTVALLVLLAELLLNFAVCHKYYRSLSSHEIENERNRPLEKKNVKIKRAGTPRRENAFYFRVYFRFFLSHSLGAWIRPRVVIEEEIRLYAQSISTLSVPNLGARKGFPIFVQHINLILTIGEQGSS